MTQKVQIVLEFLTSDDPDQQDNVCADIEQLARELLGTADDHDFGDDVEWRGNIFVQDVIETTEYQNWNLHF